MKRILFFTHNGGMKDGGGISRVFFSILKDINRDDFSIKVLLGDTGDLQEKIQSLGIECDVMPIKAVFPITCKIGPLTVPRFTAIFQNIFNGIFFIINMLFYLKREDFDILYIHSVVAQLVGTLAWSFSGKKGILVWHQHDVPKRKGVEKFWGFIAKKYVSLVISISKAMANSLRFYTKNSKCDYRVVYNSVEIENKTEKGDLDIKRDLKIPQNVLVVTMISRISEEKGHIFFVKAIKHILKTDNNLVFIIIGDSCNKSGEEYKGGLIDYIEQNGISSYIRFTGWREDVINFIKNSDILVSASTCPEGLNLSLVGALSQGVPMVSTDVGGQGEVTINGKTGFLVRKGDPIDMARKILLLASDNELRKNMGKNAKELYLRYFNSKKFIKDIEITLKDLV